jgi:drug/metabolite transporter (DMT)-like permease
MDRSASGWINGLIGVIIFSGSLPATRRGGCGVRPGVPDRRRAPVLPALLGLGCCGCSGSPGHGERPRLARHRRPRRRGRLSAADGAGAAAHHLGAFHRLYRLLPLSTAIFGVLRGGERPKPGLLAFSLFGSLLVAGFALAQGGSASLLGDGLMLAAIIVCGLGYAEGAKLSRTLGGWQVISWALVLSLPVMAVLTMLWCRRSFASGRPAGLAHGLAYVSLFSMLVGFVFWYRGLAQGGIAAVGQLQLLQPFFGLALAAGLLGETVTPAMLLVTVAVIGCVAGARRFAK